MKYKCINGWTKEQMIAQIWAKNNGKKSLAAETAFCVYRGVNNNACAAGCFIPDELYDPEMDEGLGDNYDTLISSVLEHYPQVEKYMPLETDVMISMQQIHDSCPPSKDVREELKKWIEENVE